MTFCIAGSVSVCTVTGALPGRRTVMTTRVAKGSAAATREESRLVVVTASRAPRAAGSESYRGPTSARLKPDGWLLKLTSS